VRVVNALLVTLILIPLCIAMALAAAAGALIWHQGLAEGPAVAVAIFGILGGCLAYLLWRALKHPDLHFGGGEAGIVTERRVAAFTMATAYATLAVLGLLAYGLVSLRYWLGGVAIVTAAILVAGSLLGGERRPSGRADGPADAVRNEATREALR
jgi:hypothetical protein